ncbi:MAG: DUF934 domain-containing protein [Amphritea sp.]
MQQIIKNGAITDDTWLLISVEQADSFAPQAGETYILPLELWWDHAPGFTGFTSIPGVWIDSNDELEPVADRLQQAPVIGVNFPAIADGSGFSTGSLLREVYNFTGELRAFGSLIIDQAPYLSRCGFNAISLAAGQNLEAAQQLLNNSNQTYQGSVHSPHTPFKSRYAGKQ